MHCIPVQGVVGTIYHVIDVASYIAYRYPSLLDSNALIYC